MKAALARRAPRLQRLSDNLAGEFVNGLFNAVREDSAEFGHILWRWLHPVGNRRQHADGGLYGRGLRIHSPVT